MKIWLPRLCESLAVQGMKEDILAAGTKYQIGGCPGHRQFHLFVVRALIALWMEEGEDCVLTAVNIRKFFDKQNLVLLVVDAMQTLHKAKVKKKLYRVWRKLNLKTTIQVMK